MILNLFKRKKDEKHELNNSLKITVNQELNDKILLVNELLKSYLQSESIRTPLGYNLSDTNIKSSITYIITISNSIDRIAKCIVSNDYPLITPVLEKNGGIFHLLLKMITDIHWISLARDIKITQELADKFSDLDCEIETVIQQKKVELEERRLEFLSLLQMEKESWVHLNHSLKEFDSVQKDNINKIQNLLDNTNNLLNHKGNELQLVADYNTNLLKIKKKLEKTMKNNNIEIVKWFTNIFNINLNQANYSNYLTALDKIMDYLTLYPSKPESKLVLSRILKLNNEKRMLFYFRYFRITSEIIKSSAFTFGTIQLQKESYYNDSSLYIAQKFEDILTKYQHKIYGLLNYLEHLSEPINLPNELRIIYKEQYKYDSKTNFDKIKYIFKYLTNTSSNFNIYNTQIILLEKMYSSMSNISLEKLNDFFLKNQQYLDLYSKLDFISTKYTKLSQVEFKNISNEKERLDKKLVDESEINNMEWDKLFADSLKLTIQELNMKYNEYLVENCSNQFYFNSRYKNILKTILNENKGN